MPKLNCPVWPVIAPKNTPKEQLKFLKHFYKTMDNKLSKKDYRFIKKLIKMELVLRLDTEWQHGWAAFKLTVLGKDFTY